MKKFFFESLILSVVLGACHQRHNNEAASSSLNLNNFRCENYAASNEDYESFKNFYYKHPQFGWEVTYNSQIQDANNILKKLLLTKVFYNLFQFRN